MTRVLVADDQPDIVNALRLLLKKEGYTVEAASTPADVVSQLNARDYDAALIDLNYTRDTTSGREGLDLLQQIVGLDATLPVIVMTAWASIDTAVEAMRRGAKDYVEKPWDNARLLSILRNTVELGRALRRAQRLEGENRTLRPGAFPSLIAESPAMEPVLRLMERVGPSDANVLITGEHGTGKELVANLLHQSSVRAPRPFNRRVATCARRLARHAPRPRPPPFRSSRRPAGSAGASISVQACSSTLNSPQVMASVIAPPAAASSSARSPLMSASSR